MGNPRAKFCNCKDEPRPIQGKSMPAYLKGDGVLTLNPSEKSHSYPGAMGHVTDGVLVLSRSAEKILSDVE